VLLTLLIPVVLLLGLTLLDLVPLPSPRIDAVAPGVLALAVMSTAFTGQAIAFGFDRRYGVVRRLAATALPRWLLVAGRLVAVLGVVAVQVVVLGAIAAALGWRPAPAGVGWALLLVLLGTAAFGALGLLLGGTLRAEITLAVANVVWFLLLLAGGIVVPLAQLPRPARRGRGAAAVRGPWPRACAPCSPRAPRPPPARSWSCWPGRWWPAWPRPAWSACAESQPARSRTTAAARATAPSAAQATSGRTPGGPGGDRPRQLGRGAGECGHGRDATRGRVRRGPLSTPAHAAAGRSRPAQRRSRGAACRRAAPAGPGLRERTIAAGADLRLLDRT
jgi:ABC-2 type transport system permease protein